MLFANVCAGFISSSYGQLWVWRFLGFLVSSWCLVHVGGASFAGLPVVYKAWVTFAGHALWAEVGGGITFATSRESA